MVQQVDNSLKVLVSHLVAYFGPWSWFAIKHSWILVFVTMLVFTGLAYLTSQVFAEVPPRAPLRWSHGRPEPVGPHGHHQHHGTFP